MLTDTPQTEGATSTRTALAFLLAPGAAAVAGAIVAGLVLGDGRSLGTGAFVFLVLAFAVVGYPTAAVFGVPLYLALTERARKTVALVVPLAGAVAAGPWLVGALAVKSRHADFSMAETAFALGCVAGVVFLLVRRPPEIENP